MIPVSQALAARYQPIEAEGLQAVSSITPVDAATAESPLWQRLRPGLNLSATLIQRDGQAATSALPNQLALYKVALSLPNASSANPSQAPLTQQVWMQLPASLPEGQRLQLQVLRGASLNGAPEVKWSPASMSLSANLSPASAKPDPAILLSSQAAEVNLSTPAKQLQQWLSAQPLPMQAATLQAREVVTQHPEKPQLLAQELKFALDRSGLFYESHLKEATLGTRPWHQLLQEPQNQANFQAPQTVAQQLQLLEQQRLTWQGEVWPGQAMTWQVSEKPAENGRAPDSPGSVFSNLKLTLPHLGEVSVRLTMVDGRFSIRLEADSADSQLQLKAGRPQLVNRLTEAGLALTGVQITQGVVDGHA